MRISYGLLKSLATDGDVDALNTMANWHRLEGDGAWSGKVVAYMDRHGFSLVDGRTSTPKTTRTMMGMAAMQSPEAIASLRRTLLGLPAVSQG